jgi:N-acetylmuramoyl-L-alanine amidase
MAAPYRIRYIPSPNYSARPDPDDIDCIILHHTASAAGADAIAKYFQDPNNEVSSHYVVGKSGRIIRCVPDSKKAWHAGNSVFRGRSNVNDFSIGIEICNRGDNKDPYPDAQVMAVAYLCDLMMKRHPRIKRDRITEHEVVSTTGKIDLRPNWPWPKFYRFLATKPWELTNRTLEVPVPVKKPTWWKKFREWLKLVKTVEK